MKHMPMLMHTFTQPEPSTIHHSQRLWRRSPGGRQLQGNLLIKTPQEQLEVRDHLPS